MDIVEFKNIFHIKTDFGRFKDYQQTAIKSICFVEEWEIGFAGNLVRKPSEVGIGVFAEENINKPYQHLTTATSTIFRKNTQAAKFLWEKKAWVLPTRCKKYVYEIGKKYKANHIELLEDLPEQVDTLPSLPELTIDIPLKKGEMRPYQKTGVARGLELKRFINGDMPGLGKTLQSVATVYGAEMQGNNSFPCLVICPSSLKINWKREFEMWTNKRCIILDDKNKNTWHRYYEVGAAHVFIVNYESMKKFFVKNYPKDIKHSSEIGMDYRVNLFNSIIIDEIHKLKNPTSQRTKIAVNITKGKEYIIGLTGTPVVNKPIDLWAQLAIIFQLSKIGGPIGFKKRYCEGGSGASNLKELNYLLNKHCFFRREKHEVLKDLPAKVRQTIFCEISTKQEYDLVEKDFRKFLETNDFSDKEIRRKLKAEVIVKITLLLQISAKGKIEAAKEYIDEVIESGQKIVIFSKHKSVVDMLCLEYPHAVRVTGSENETQKQTSVDKFQKDDKTNIIIGSHKAAGVGLTLTAASEVLFLELPWHYADLEQCEDRCHRIGQVNSVRATSLLGIDTIDKWLYDLIQEKKKIADQVTGAEDVVETNLLDNILNAFKR